MRKTFIEASTHQLLARLHARRSLPLMRKTFIEAPLRTLPAEQARCLFRLCGRLSLRPSTSRHNPHPLVTSLPLMRKTFMEASTKLSTKHPR